MTSAGAQTSASLAGGASIVEYDGFLTSAAATLSPTVRFDAADLSIGGQGSWTVFESGNQIVQASAAAGWLTQAREGWRVELSAAGGASRYADQPASGHLITRGRLHLFSTQHGGWISAATGATFDGSTAAPFELGVGAWTIHDRLALVGTVIGTWVGDERHTDVAGAARWSGERVEIEARVGARPWTNRPDTLIDAPARIWGELAALIPVAARISLALSGGSYSSDPVRGVLGARYATAGFRLELAGRERPQLHTMPTAIATVYDRASASNTSGARLEITTGGEGSLLRVHVAGARAVELMGDFNDWQPQPLTRIDERLWQLELRLPDGVYRLNIRIDGGPWLVPAGARPEEDEFGGVVGVVVVR